MKKILTIGLIASLISMIVFKATFSNKKALVVIGDSTCSFGKRKQNYNYQLKSYLMKHNILKEYNDDYCKSNLSIRKINKYLHDNHKNNEQTILSLLNKASYLTISLGDDEFNQYKIINNTITYDFLTEFKYLITTIKNNSDAKIFVIGIETNENKLLNELNRKISKICQNNNVVFINPNLLSKSRSFFDIIINYI